MILLNEIIENIRSKSLELIFDNNPNFNDYEEDISMLNEEYDRSEYLNDVMPEKDELDNNYEYLDINEFFLKI